MRKIFNSIQSKREVDLFHNGACLDESLPSNGRVRQQIQGCFALLCGAPQRKSLCEKTALTFM